MKLTKFLNTCVAHDFPEMKLFRNEKCFGNQFREVSQLEIFKLIIYRPNFHKKTVFFEKNTKTFGKLKNTQDIHFATLMGLLIEYP
jgi:hypothetical protein